MPCDENYCAESPDVSDINRETCFRCFGNNCTFPRRSCLIFQENCNCTNQKKQNIDPRSENCTTFVGVVCSNCSSLDALPSNWYYLANETSLICTLQNDTSITITEGTTTTNLPVTLPSTTECPARDLSHFTIGKNTSCSPLPDGFNPCTDLLSEENSLRIAIWFVIVLALLGNGSVIFVFLFYTVAVRHMNMDLFVMHFLYFNLAIADFLMSIYLLSIAAEDLYTLGDFSAHDIKWRRDGGCQFAGFTAILSTVVSVYVLTVITIERGYTLINVMHKRKMTKRFALVVMAIGWALGILLASLPLSGLVNDYGSVAICLPFRVTSMLDISYIVFLLVATGLAFIAISITYVLIFVNVFLKKSYAQSISNNRRKVDIKIAIRMFILAFTNFLAWFPIALVSLASVFGDGIVQDINFAKWAIVFIFPLNSCINPLLYSLSTKKFRENFIIALSKLKLCEKSAKSIAQSRAGVITHSTTSGGSGFDQRRPSFLDRFRLLSISSSSFRSGPPSSTSRRDSNLSQASDLEHFRMYTGRRRSSVMSDGSSDSQPGRLALFRGSSGTSVDNTIENPNFRSSSPVNLTANDSNRSARAPVKNSVSSLGTLTEENEQIIPVPMDVIKLNPAYIEEDTDSGTMTGPSQVELDIHLSEQHVHHQIHCAGIIDNENASNSSGNYSKSPSVEEIHGSQKDD